MPVERLIEAKKDLFGRIFRWYSAILRTIQSLQHLRSKHCGKQEKKVLQIHLLGQFDVRLDGKRALIPSRSGQSLLAYLALTAGTTHRREKLAGTIWPEVPEETARKNLRQELWRIRKAIPARHATTAKDNLLSDDFTITFNPEADFWLDVVRLEQSAADLQSLTAGLSLYRGELLPGFYDDWILPERERIQNLFEARMDELVGKLVEEERWAAVQEQCERWLALGHAPEPAYRALMLSYNAHGDMARISATYQRCVDDLQEKFGVEPSAETHILYHELLIRSWETPRAVPVQPSGKGTRSFNNIKGPRQPLDKLSEHHATEAPTPGTPPFKGLQYFDEADSDLFFGREALTARLVDCLGDASFLTVIVGASGSGKSSLVRAGLIPALKKGSPLNGGTERPANTRDWEIHVITPTAHPLKALSVTLTRPSEPLTTAVNLIDDLSRDPGSLSRFLARQHPRRHTLLLIDQFEELFTLCRDEFEREAFIDNLLHATLNSRESITTVITLRADFYAHLARYPELRDIVTEQQVYIGPMTSDELRRAIEEPAARGHWEFEPGLVDLILRDAGDEPGALPLLSHALLETWKRRAGHTLTLKGYAEAGGVRGAIAQTAESFYHNLSSEEQRIARDIFLRLTELGEGTEDTRRRASFEELLSHTEHLDKARAVLNTLADARLVTLGEHSAEVAHEALIREWPTLRDWLNQDREGLRLHRRLAEAAREWKLLEYDPGTLYRGTHLAQVREWMELHPKALNPEEHMFLDASIQQEQLEQQQQAAQLANLTRTEALLLAVEANRLLAAGGSPERIALLSLRSMAMQYTPQGDEALTAASRLDYPRMIYSGSPGLQTAAFSPDGSYFVTGSFDSTVQVWSVTGRTAHRLVGHTDAVSSLEYSPDGKYILTGSWDGTVRLWETATGQQVSLFSVPGKMVMSAVYSPDGKYILAGTTDGTARLWEAATGHELHRFTGHCDQITSVAFSHAGDDILLGNNDGTIQRWNIETGQEVLSVPGHASGVADLLFSADDRSILTVSYDTKAALWEAATGRKLKSFTGHTTSINGLAFSLDGKYLFTASDDGTARMWDIQTGQERRQFSSSNMVRDVVPSRDGKSILTVSHDGNAQLWNIEPKAELPALQDDSGVSGLAFSPDGNLILSGNGNGVARIWDARTGQSRHKLSGHTDVINYGVAFSPDGKKVVTGSWDKTVCIWDLATGQQLGQFTGHTAGVNSVTFSPDGRYVLSAGMDGARLWDPETCQEVFQLTGVDRLWRAVFSPDGRNIATGRNSTENSLQLWDAVTGQLLYQFTGVPGSAFSLAYLPDGKHIICTAADGIACLCDIHSGQVLRQFVGHTGVLNGLSISPDGKYLATSSHDGTARLWDIQTGQELRRFIGHTAGVENVIFSPDGKYILTGSDDGTMLLWDVDYHTTLNYLCSVLQRDFTEAERAQYNITDATPTCPK
jgi:WD40 repeat protein/DNA-binding SARP family transcriptional activator